MTTCFESLSVEILYEVFDFLSLYHLLRAFGDLNKQYNVILSNRPVHVRLDPVEMSANTFRTYYLDYILPNCAYQVVSISIVQKWTLDIGELFLRYQPTGLAPYVNLRALKLIHVKHALFAHLLNSVSRHLQTLIVKIDNWRGPNHDSELESLESTWLVRVLNTLPDLSVCHINDFHWNIRTSINTFEPFEHDVFARLFSLTINECISLTFIAHVLERTPRLRRLRARFVCPVHDQHMQKVPVFDGSTTVPDLRHITMHFDCGWLLENVIVFLHSVLPRLAHLSLTVDMKASAPAHRTVDGSRLLPSLRLLSSQCMFSLDLLTEFRDEVIGFDTLLTALPHISKSPIFADERQVMPVPDLREWVSFRVVCGNKRRTYRRLSTQWLSITDNLRRVRSLELSDPTRDDELSRMLDVHEPLNELQHLYILGSRLGPVNPLINLIAKIMSQAPYLTHLSLEESPFTIQSLLALTSRDTYALFSRIRHLTLILWNNGDDHVLLDFALRFSNLRMFSILLYTMEILPAIRILVEHLKYLTMLRIDRVNRPDPQNPLTIEMLAYEPSLQSAHVQMLCPDGFVIWF